MIHALEWAKLISIVLSARIASTAAFLPAQLCAHCTAPRPLAHAQFSAPLAVLSEIEMTETSILPAAEKCGKGSSRTEEYVVLISLLSVYQVFKTQRATSSIKSCGR